ncbi:MAG TPA: cadmium resistance transporter [Pyrinomonadaceae bacterium]|nr:cadmium resistance transporter [Pyrinomonadaceae bacterium]
MPAVLQTIAAAAVAFAATNIDDIFVLMLFFAEAGRGIRRWQVVLGQYAGFAALVAISLVGYFARYVAPEEWIGLLGILPIMIGLKKLWELRKGEEDEEAQVERRASRAVFTVAAVTFANGGDNLGIYTPLFASLSLPELLVTLAVFFLAVAVWCALGYYLSRHPAVYRVLDRYGHLIVPFVLIALGFYIMIESGTFRLL